jgi:hypothetical protein
MPKSRTKISPSDLLRPRWLEFDAERHIYYVDEMPLRSVTETLQAAGIGMDYDALHPAAQKYVRRAKWRSKHVHASWAASWLGMLLEDEVPEAALPQLQAAMQLSSEVQMDTLAVETPMACRELDLAGTEDWIGYRELRLAIVDLKGTAKIDGESEGLQLTAYAQLASRTLRRRGIDVAPEDFELWVLWSPKKGKPEWIEFEHDPVGFERIYG